MITLISPAIIIAVSLVVGQMITALYLPIYNLGN